MGLGFACKDKLDRPVKLSVQIDANRFCRFQTHRKHTDTKTDRQKLQVTCERTTQYYPASSILVHVLSKVRNVVCKSPACRTTKTTEEFEEKL